MLSKNLNLKACTLNNFTSVYVCIGGNGGSGVIVGVYIKMGYKSKLMCLWKYHKNNVGCYIAVGGG